MSGNHLCLYLGAALRWMRNHGRKRFTIDEAYGIYMQLAPRVSMESRQSIAHALRRYHSLFGVRTSEQTKKSRNSVLKVYVFIEGHTEGF